MLRPQLMVGTEILKRAEPLPPLVAAFLVDVGLEIEVASADWTETLAVGPAERGEWRREDDLLANERGEIDPEVATDRLRVQRRGRFLRAADDFHRSVVVFGVLRLAGGL